MANGYSLSSTMWLVMCGPNSSGAPPQLPLAWPAAIRDTSDRLHAFDDVVGCFVEALHNRLNLSAGDRINIQIGAACGLEEFGIAHRLVESSAQRDHAIFRHARWSRQRATHLLGCKQILQCYPVFRLA